MGRPGSERPIKSPELQKNKIPKFINFIILASKQMQQKYVIHEYYNNCPISDVISKGTLYSPSDILFKIAPRSHFRAFIAAPNAKIWRLHKGYSVLSFWCLDPDPYWPLCVLVQTRIYCKTSTKCKNWKKVWLNKQKQTQWGCVYSCAIREFKWNRRWFELGFQWIHLTITIRIRFQVDD